MSKLTIFGASDDLVEVEGEFREEFAAFDARPWRGRVVAPGGESLIVTAEFGKPGGHDGWVLGVENDGDSWPSWVIHFTVAESVELDPAIVIDVPEGTIVEEVSS